MAFQDLNKRHLHALAAIILIIAGCLFIFTTSVAPAVIGLVLVLVAGVFVFLGQQRQ